MTQAPSSSPIATDAEPDIAAAGLRAGHALPAGLTAEDLVEVCRQMVLVRTMDERIWMMNRQGKVPIAASCQGHEAAQLGSLLAAQKGRRLFPLSLLPRSGRQDGRGPYPAPGDALLYGQGR